MFMKFDLLGEEREHELLSSAYSAVGNIFDKDTSKNTTKKEILFHKSV